MKSKVIGLILFAVIAVIGIVIVTTGPRSNAVTIKGYVGGEKIGLLQDEEVQNILKKDYGLIVDYTKAGSIEMARSDVTDLDFIFPSSQIALEIFKNEQGTIYKSEKVFNSPIVIYSWKEIANEMIKEGIVHKVGDTHYINPKKLISYIEKDTEWSDLGIDLYGTIKVISTDPNKSNSGNMYLGLLSNMLNDGMVVDDANIDTVLPRAKSIFDKLGYMESSSGNVFSRYLSLGMGDSPLVVGYENQLIEYAIDNPDIWKQVKDRVVIFYPEPTVWSEHPVIALNENGKNLITALSDDKIQKIAWQRHGFRTGLITVENDASIIDIIGIPETISKVIPMPNARIMEKLMEGLLK